MIKVSDGYVFVERSGNRVAYCPEVEYARRIDLALDLVEGISTDDLARLVASDKAREAIALLAESRALVAKISSAVAANLRATNDTSED